MPHVYVTGHRNPDTDTIASAIGYAEYKNLVDPDNRYVAARLGEVNTQTAWALEKSGAEQPELLEHIMLRVKDVMAGDVAVANKNDPLRTVGLTMARRNVSQVPIVEDDGSLTGIITERNLARMYVRESRGASTFAESPVSVGAMVTVLEGELLVGEEDRESTGQLWVISMSVDSMGKSMARGDIVVIGDRPEGPEEGHRPGRRRASRLQRGASRRRGAGAGQGEGDGRRALSPRLLRDQSPDTALHPLLGGHEREPPHRQPRRPGNGDNRAGHGGPLQGRNRRRRQAGAHRGRDEDGPPEPQTEARAPRRPRRDRAERQGRRAGGGRGDTGPPPRRGHRDYYPHLGHLRPRRLDGDPDRGALQGERPLPRGIDSQDAARGAPVGHGDPELPDHHRPGPRGRRIPRGAARVGR